MSGGAMPPNPIPGAKLGGGPREGGGPNEDMPDERPGGGAGAWKEGAGGGGAGACWVAQGAAAFYTRLV